MADHFKVSGSNTGDYYTIDKKTGKRQFFDKQGNKLEQSVFLNRNNAVIDKNNSMRKKENVDAHSNLVKHYYKGSKTGRYYTVDPKTGTKKYYAANGHPINESYFMQKEKEAVDAAKLTQKTKALKSTKKSWFGRTWDNIKTIGKDIVDHPGDYWKGVKKSVTSMWQDEQGNFSWKQLGKTVGTCVLVTAAAAALVGAEVLTGGQVTWLLVGAGAAMGTYSTYKGGEKVLNATTEKERKAGREQAGEGAGTIAMSVAIKKPMAKGMKTASIAGKTAKAEALYNGSGRFAATVKGTTAAVKTVVPTPKQVIKSVGDGIKGGAKVVRHPVRTVRTAVENHRTIKAQNTEIKTDIANVRTQNDIALAREKVNSNPNLSASKKAKYNKQLDKLSKTTEHDNFQAATKKYNDAVTKEGATPEQIKTAQTEYKQAIDNSTNVEALKARKAKLGTPKEGTPQARELDAINKRIEVVNKRLETRFDNMISESRLREKDVTELKSRINDEVKDPELKAKLNKKIEQKQKLLNDIAESKRHPSFDEYKDLINRANDEVSLDLLTKKLSKDHFGVSRNKYNVPRRFQRPSKLNSTERQALYREVFRKQHELNPEKYPDFEAKLAEPRNQIRSKINEAKTKEDVSAIRKEIKESSLPKREKAKLNKQLDKVEKEIKGDTPSFRQRIANGVRNAFDRVTGRNKKAAAKTEAEGAAPKGDEAEVVSAETTKAEMTPELKARNTIDMSKTEINPDGSGVKKYNSDGELLYESKNERIDGELVPRERTTYKYDSNGHTETTNIYSKDGKTVNSINETTYQKINGKDAVVKDVVKDGNGKVEGGHVYEYDNAGNRTNIRELTETEINELNKGTPKTEATAEEPENSTTTSVERDVNGFADPKEYHKMSDSELAAEYKNLHDYEAEGTRHIIQHGEDTPIEINSHETFNQRHAIREELASRGKKLTRENDNYTVKDDPKAKAEADANAQTKATAKRLQDKINDINENTPKEQLDAISDEIGKMPDGSEKTALTKAMSEKTESLTKRPATETTQQKNETPKAPKNEGEVSAEDQLKDAKATLEFLKHQREEMANDPYKAPEQIESLDAEIKVAQERVNKAEVRVKAKNETPKVETTTENNNTTATTEETPATNNTGRKGTPNLDKMPDHGDMHKMTRENFEKNIKNEVQEELPHIDSETELNAFKEKIDAKISNNRKYRRELDAMVEQRRAELKAADNVTQNKPATEVQKKEEIAPTNTEAVATDEINTPTLDHYVSHSGRIGGRKQNIIKDEVKESLKNIHTEEGLNTLQTKINKLDKNTTLRDELTNMVNERRAQIKNGDAAPAKPAEKPADKAEENPTNTSTENEQQIQSEIESLKGDESLKDMDALRERIDNVKDPAVQEKLNDALSKKIKDLNKARNKAANESKLTEEKPAEEKPAEEKLTEEKPANVKDNADPYKPVKLGKKTKMSGGGLGMTITGAILSQVNNNEEQQDTTQAQQTPAQEEVTEETPVDETTTPEDNNSDSTTGDSTTEDGAGASDSSTTPAAGSSDSGNVSNSNGDGKVNNSSSEQRANDAVKSIENQINNAKTLDDIANIRKTIEDNKDLSKQQKDDLMKKVDKKEQEILAQQNKPDSKPDGKPDGKTDDTPSDNKPTAQTSGFHIKNYISGRDASGNKRDITPAERAILTDQINKAKTLDDIALIYSEMGSFNRFDGRRNLRRALKQKRKEIEAQMDNNVQAENKAKDKFADRIAQVNADNVEATQGDNSVAFEGSTKDLKGMKAVKDNNIFHRLFRGKQYKLDGELPETDIGNTKADNLGDGIEKPKHLDISDGIGNDDNDLA